jgi:two-component system NtrC family response regulator
MGIKNARILFIEDDPSGRELGIFNLKKAGYEVDGASDGKQALKRFAISTYDLVISDVKMPGMSGLDVLAKIRETSDVPFLVITAFADVETAVTAMKAGADDFIGKPFNRDYLLMTIEKALSAHALGKEVRKLRIQSSGIARPIIFKSEMMRQVLAVTDKVAASDATVLVTGESGTGKELIARRIHVESARAEMPFVANNAAAIPGELLESELFGHKKGAFTGATLDRVGKFRQAHGGTLFLDEIAELPVGLQTKLLRVLQERIVDVVGGDTPVDVNVRVVTATNRNLAEEVRERRFREDLFYRLNVVEVHVPPLRERSDDVAPLARHFVSMHAEGRDLGITDTVQDKLAAYDWPGNVRELGNVCQRLAILATGRDVNETDLPFLDVGNRADLRAVDPFEQWPPLPRFGLSLIDLERRVIERALAFNDNNVSRTAGYLSIPRHVLSYRMQKYGITKRD